jgi:serine/threonine protein kinase
VILTPGLSFGAYKIIAPLGRGGMGEVYRARDSRLGREVALKILREDGAADPDRVRRFEQEARAASSLNHPNIVVVYEVGDAPMPGESRPTRYLAMELLEGRPLNMVLSGEPLSTRRFLDIAFQLADGLARAHEGGIVHRDLKPSNVVVSSEGHVKILDFGLAKLRPVPGEDSGSVLTLDETKTSPGAVLGTVGYMSPEQARGEPATAASDQFSLGCIFYEMLTGHGPFWRKSPADTLSAILRDDPPPIADSNPNVPAPLCWVVERCLAKSPDDRYVSTRDLARELQTFRQHSAEVMARAFPKASRVKRRRRVLKVAAATALLVLGGAAALVLTQSLKTRPEPDFRQLTFRKGVVRRALFVPNSDNILYTASWDGSPTKSYVTIPESTGNDRSLEAEDQLPMAYTRDGAQLLVLLGISRARINANGTLAWRPALGGKPRPILQNAGWADWAETSRRFAVVRDAGAERLLEVRRADGSLERSIFRTAGGISYVRFSPRADQVAFIHHPSRYDDGGEVRIAETDGSGSEAVTPGFERCVGLDWNERTSDIWFTGSPASSANSTLWRVSPSGRMRPIQSLTAFFALQDVSPSGDRCLMISGASGTRLFVHTKSEPVKDLTWLGSSMVSDISPDGKNLLFIDVAGASRQTEGIWMRPVDGGEAVRLGRGSLARFSPDGRSMIALSPLLSGPQQLVLLSVETGATRPLTSSEASHTMPSFAGPNTILFVRSVGGTSEVWRMETDGSGARSLGAAGCILPIANPSGTSFVCRGGNQPRTLYLYPMEPGAGRRLYELQSGGDIAYIRWNSSGTEIYAVTQDRYFLAIDSSSGAVKRRTPLDLGEDSGNEPLLAVAMDADASVQAYSLDRFSAALYLATGL